MEQKEIDFLEKVVEVLKDNGFKNTFYTSNGEVIYPANEPARYYVDKYGNDKSLERIADQDIPGCKWVENPKFTIFKDLVKECAGSSFSNIDGTTISWSCTGLNVKENPLYKFLGQFGIDKSKVRVSGTRILVMQLIHPLVRERVFQEWKTASKGTEFENYGLAMLC